MNWADFSDCMIDGPMKGEVGWIGEHWELLEYPCNCDYCRGWEPIEADDLGSALI